MKVIVAIAVAAGFSISMGHALAQQVNAKKIDLFPKDNRTYAEKEQARSESQANKGHEEMQRRQQAEQMRDKTHDNRLKTGPNTSVGVQTDPRGVNVRTTTR